MSKQAESEVKIGYESFEQWSKVKNYILSKEDLHLKGSEIVQWNFYPVKLKKDGSINKTDYSLRIRFVEAKNKNVIKVTVQAKSQKQENIVNVKPEETCEIIYSDLAQFFKLKNQFTPHLAFKQSDILNEKCKNAKNGEVFESVQLFLKNISLEDFSVKKLEKYFIFSSSITQRFVYRGNYFFRDYKVAFDETEFPDGFKSYELEVESLERSSNPKMIEKLANQVTKEIDEIHRECHLPPPHYPLLGKRSTAFFHRSS